MAIAAASRSLVAYSAAQPFGGSFAEPSYQLMRRSSGGLRTKKTADKVGGVLRRGPVAVVQTAQDVAGSYAFELSGGWIDDLLAAALCGQWVGNELCDGSIETALTFAEISAAGASAYVQRAYSGCRVAGLEMDFAARAVGRGVVDVVGAREEVGSVWEVPFSPSSVTPATALWTTPTMTAIALLDLAPTPPIRRLALAVRHDVTMGHGVMSIHGQPRGVGGATVNGVIEAYFSSATLYQSMLDHGAGPISFAIGPAGSRYVFAIPKAQLGDGSLVSGGKDDDLIATIPFEAVSGPYGEQLLTIRRNAP